MNDVRVLSLADLISLWMRQNRVLNKVPPELTYISDPALYDYERMKNPDLEV